jgi:hypothetical protein
MPSKKETEEEPCELTEEEPCELTEEELDELLIKTAKKEIRSDYRRSLGCESSRRCMDTKGSSSKKK